MMLRKFALPAAVALLLAGTVAAPVHAQDAADVEAVVAAVKASKPDFKAFCQTGADNIRKTVSETVTQLASQGKLKGDPRQAGGAAGAKIGQECRGG